MVAGRTFILVDPVDGTREFLSHNGEFTVNIGLIIDAEPCAGVVYAPAFGQLWIGGAAASTCEAAPGAPLPPPKQRRAIHARPAPGQGLAALVSRSHADPATKSFLAKLPVKERRQAGSALKFCVIAEGHADVYPRFGQTMEWDTAAGDAVLRAAGGIVFDGAGRPLRYGKTKRNSETGLLSPGAIQRRPFFEHRKATAGIIRYYGATAISGLTQHHPFDKNGCMLRVQL